MKDFKEQQSAEIEVQKCKLLVNAIKVHDYDSNLLICYEECSNIKNEL